MCWRKQVLEFSQVILYYSIIHQYMHSNIYYHLWEISSRIRKVNRPTGIKKYDNSFLFWLSLSVTQTFRKLSYFEKLNLKYIANKRKEQWWDICFLSIDCISLTKRTKLQSEVQETRALKALSSDHTSYVCLYSIISYNFVCVFICFVSMSYMLLCMWAYIPVNTYRLEKKFGFLILTFSFLFF